MAASRHPRKIHRLSSSTPRRSVRPVKGGSSNQRRQHFIQSRAFVIILLALVVALSISVTRETVRRIAIHREISILEERIAEQQQKYNEMQATTKILNTSTAAEKQSRLTLNTASPGEKVIILKSSGGSPQTTGLVLPSGENVDTVSPEDSFSNPQKWIRYFFQ